MFENLKKDTSIDQDPDFIPSSGSNKLASAVYPATIDMAYVEKSSGGATGIVLQFLLESGRKFNQTLWVTNKKGEHVWIKGDRKGYLPGFTLFDEICQLVVGCNASDLPDPEKRTINVYNWDQRKELPTEKDVLLSLIGGQLKLGIHQVKEDHYQESTSWVEKNEIHKVFSEDGKTANEKAANVENPQTLSSWENRYQFADIDKRQKSKEGPQYKRQQQSSAPKTDSDAGAAAGKMSIFDQ